MNDTIVQPWTVTLTQPQHDLILFGMVATGLVLLATLVRVRFGTGESQGSFRVASLTANAVVAIAFVSYLTLVTAFILGYRQTDSGLFQPTALARYAWALRYMDWVVTVPLLVIELVAVSALTERAAIWTRRIGMTAAAVMIVLGFLGAFVIDDGRSFATYSLFGALAAGCFLILYVLIFAMMRASIPQLPAEARNPYRTAIVLLLIIWLLYPIVYGFSGVLDASAAVVTGQLLLCGADMIAKVGFGTLVHRTSVLRSRHDEDLDPSSPPGRDSPPATPCTSPAPATSTSTDPRAHRHPIRRPRCSISGQTAPDGTSHATRATPTQPEPQPRLAPYRRRSVGTAPTTAPPDAA